MPIVRRSKRLSLGHQRAFLGQNVRKDFAFYPGSYVANRPVGAVRLMEKMITITEAAGDRRPRAPCSGSAGLTCRPWSRHAWWT